MKKSSIRIVCFLLILLLVLGFWNGVFKVKHGDGIYDLKKFYELDRDTVDVLVLGSSHAFQAFNTGTLWDEYGISSFILGGAVQPMWNSYYYLKEALKTQSPKLILLEGYGSSFTFDYGEDSQIIKNTFGLRWSLDKVNAILASAPRERWWEFLLSYSQYHTRYKELNSTDFLPDQGNPLFFDWKGFGCAMQTTPLEAIDARTITGTLELTEKTEKYYRAIVELAREAGIPIEVIVSPFSSIGEEQQKRFNRAGEIAAELDVPYLNCNLLVEEIGIDYATDVPDTEHLNYRGNRKFTKYIGNYLKGKYELPDHRGETKYATWQRNADYIRHIISNQELKEASDLSSILPKIQDPSYWIFVSADGSCDLSSANASLLLESLGIREKTANGLWHVQGGKVLWQSSAEEPERYLRTELHDFHLLQQCTDGIAVNSVIMDRESFKKVEHGVNVLVYDTVSWKIVDQFGLDAANAYQVVR